MVKYFNMIPVKHCFATTQQCKLPLSTYLGDIEEPQQVGHRGVLGIIGGAGDNGVTITVREHESLHAHVRAQNDLRMKKASTKQHKRESGGMRRMSTTG